MRKSSSHRRPNTAARTAFRLGILSFLPLVVWWLGFFPGFMSSDSIDQLGQIQRFEISNFHPAFHTITLWAITRIWNSPGAVTLAQAAVMALLLGLIATRLVKLGVRPWLSVAAVWFVSLLPAVGATTITIWKDVPYTLALLWVFAETLSIAADPKGFWTSWAGPARLGLALGLAWLYRQNGFITVVLFGLVLAIVFRRQLRGLIITGATTAVVVVAAHTLVFNAFGVTPATIEPSEVFIPDVAAVLADDPEVFTNADLAVLKRIAPLDIWTGRYSCYESTSLVFDPSFDVAAIRSDPASFRAVVARAALGDPAAVLRHRLCAASYLFVPVQPDGAYFHRPPFDIPPNTLGIARDPVSWKAHAIAKAIFVWAEPDDRLWLTWRPAIALWIAAAGYVLLAARRRWRLLLPGALLAAQLINVAALSPAQEFRYAFGLYVMAWLSVPLIAASAGRASGKHQP